MAARDAEAALEPLVPMIDLVAEYLALKDDIDTAIQRVIASGSFTLGPEVEAFEAEFAAYCGARYAVGVGSGSAALHLALLGYQIGRGDEVITVCNSDLPTTTAISQAGAAIVWVDVAPQTFTMDPGQIEARITRRTRAILPVHLHGQPAAMDLILDIARRHGLLVIEDAALAVGAEYRGRKVGTLGHVGCFSLAPGKILGAYGDGGVVVTDDPAIAERVRVLRNYGFGLELEQTLGGVLGFERWRLVAEGFNERLDALQAAILRAKLPTLERRIERRRAAAAEYDRRLAGLELVTPHEAAGTRHVYRAYAVLVEDRERVRTHLAGRGIATRVYYNPPLHLQPVYRSLGFGPGSFPHAEYAGERLLGLPLFPEISQGQIGLVVAALAECVPAGP